MTTKGQFESMLRNASWQEDIDKWTDADHIWYAWDRILYWPTQSRSVRMPEKVGLPTRPTDQWDPSTYEGPALSIIEFKAERDTERCSEFKSEEVIVGTFKGTSLVVWTTKHGTTRTLPQVSGETK